MARSSDEYRATIKSINSPKCPCGASEIEGQRLNHDGNAPCCEEYCNPDTCECRSSMAPTNEQEHAAWVRLGSPGAVALLDRLVATQVAMGVDSRRAENEAVALYVDRSLAGLAYEVEKAEAAQKPAVTVQRIYPVTAETVKFLELLSEGTVRLGCSMTAPCGECQHCEVVAVCQCSQPAKTFTRPAFDALARPNGGDFQEGAACDEGYILRLCPGCGSTRARKATREECTQHLVDKLRHDPEFGPHMDAWKLAAQKHQDDALVLEEVAVAISVERANDDAEEEDWRDEARSGYLADLGVASGWQQ